MSKSAAKSYTKAEVAQHNTLADFWTIVYGKVYHLDEVFLTQLHPGGMYVMEAAGKDGTALFEDNGHNEHAREMLEQFYVGNLQKE